MKQGNNYYEWEQSDDGWFNIWVCHRGNNWYVRLEKDGLPMRESTAYIILKKLCQNCVNKGGCKFYELYR